MKEEGTQRKKATVKNTSEVYKGRIFNFVTEDLTLPNGRNAEIAFVRHPVGEYLLEIPAGTMEPGESPLDCAQRELIEETGFRIEKLRTHHLLTATRNPQREVFI